MIKNYSQLVSFHTFKDRFEYLKLGGVVGHSTFGFERYLNQNFYRSSEWKRTRREIIIRDNGCDLADPEYEIVGRIIVHHLNPITIDDIEFGRDCLFDPENLVCTSHMTSEAIHYGDYSLLPKPLIDRTRGDTTLWL